MEQLPYLFQHFVVEPEQAEQFNELLLHNLLRADATSLMT
jgi:hypothetical protein